jgi:Flp pilus assembly protein TadG
MRTRPTPKLAAPADRRRRHRSRGQGLVEFALILPVFLVLMSAAIDLGRLAYARIAVENAAREGAFQASVTPTSFQAGQPCPPIDPITGQPPTNLVICRALLEAAGSVITVSPSDVSVTCSPSCAEGMGNTVTVAVNGQFQLLTPFMAVFFGGYTIDFTSSSTMQIETFPEPLATATPTPTPTPTPSPTSSASPTPTPALTPGCILPSAGFTYTAVPSSNTSPVTMTVLDTSSSANGCPINSWAWDWGDGVTTFGQVQAPHVFYNFGPPANVTYSITLTVSNAAGSSTSAAVIITVKKN